MYANATDALTGVYDRDALAEFGALDGGVVAGGAASYDYEVVIGLQGVSPCYFRRYRG